MFEAGWVHGSGTSGDSDPRSAAFDELLQLLTPHNSPTSGLVHGRPLAARG